MIDLINYTKKVYKELFEEKIFLEHLTYFDDMLNFDIDYIASDFKPSVSDIKEYFKKLVEDYIEKKF
ncbi:MAG: hypothetical protein ACYDBX_03680 [Patescibacteria group bacterium]